MTGRIVFAIFLTLGLSLESRGQNAEKVPLRVPEQLGTDVSAVAEPLLKQYCVTCHNQNARMGGLALDSLNTRNVGENTTAWENVLRRLRARREPPSGNPRPDDATSRSLISKLELALDQAYLTNGLLNSADRVSDAELAKRIAKFIWGDAPDAQLLENAHEGRLHDPVVLDQQVRRMLQDSKSDNLVTNFFERWLSLDRLEKAKPDPKLFPAFDPELLQSMGTETRLFLDNQLREDHGALELWTADYTFLNERLARHYGIANVSGSEFRRVTWPDKNRAGLLGQGSWLTVTSISNRTSPIIRGKSILENVFGTPTPPPAPSVPPLGNSPTDQARPMRERVTAHKTNPACVNCHANFDPLGFALENFDAIGQWRNTDGGAVIDASGNFIDGTGFNGPAELRTGLLKYRDAFYSNLTQQLLGYALGRKGRPWRVYDPEMASVRAILRTAAASDYSWSAIIAGIAKSAPFQMNVVLP
jgi:hypothetical protein